MTSCSHRSCVISSSVMYSHPLCVILFTPLLVGVMFTPVSVWRPVFTPALDVLCSYFHCVTSCNVMCSHLRYVTPCSHLCCVASCSHLCCDSMFSGVFTPTLFDVVFTPTLCGVMFNHVFTCTLCDVCSYQRPVFTRAWRWVRRLILRPKTDSRKTCGCESCFP